MNTKEAFKVGFLHKCAEDGLTPEQTFARAKKATAMMKVAGAGAELLGGAKDVVGGAGSLLWRLGLPAALLGPPAVGALGGYGIAQLGEETFDAEEAKKRELVAAYERASQQLERSKQRQLTQT